MKSEELEQSKKLGKYFSARREETPMLSSLDVESLLAQHEMHRNIKTSSRATWNPIGFRANKKFVVSFGSAVALGLASYLIFVSGVRNEIENTAVNQKPNGPSYASSLHTQSIVISNQNPLPTKIGKLDRQSSSTVSVKAFAVSSLKENTSTDKLTAVNTFQSDTSSNSDTNFCLSISAYHVLSQPISLAISQNTRVQAYHPLLTSPEKDQKEIHSSLLGANDDLLGNLYIIGYKSLAHPVIAAYDTVKSVGERTIATLSTIVPHS